jgi:hypothetical protein
MKRELDITKLASIGLIALALFLAVTHGYRLELPWMKFEPVSEVTE